ncbi:AT-hook motif nuclear-localized protein 10-like [Iris pallida]|uniref:AT-hook motif nuclear-localized protein n=1 Tax=Iris pallida TaxID=29817 RepID=A0AAX6GK68_IRIPA|nr:AT-hook motif nuclear-localized protein 10-like [Iris pallida]
MEVRSDSFSISGVQSPPMSSPSAPPHMRMTFAPDGTAVYRPMVTAGAAASGGGAGDGTQSVEAVKRKRGRPRKYGPDGSMRSPKAALVSGSGAPVAGSGASGGGGGGFSGGSVGVVSAVAAASGDGSATDVKKKGKGGRPPGSGKKLQMDALGSRGIGFTPHVITIKTGEDVSSKVMSFSQNGPRAVCILSANGAISNVTLRQAATSGGTVTYEGRFEILSLSGSFLLSEIGGQRSRTGGLSVSLAGPDGRVLGGGVAGLLTAASPVQVVVGSFIADAPKESKHTTPTDPIMAPGMFSGGMMLGASSPPSRGTVSESSGGPGSPFNQNINGNQLGLSNMTWK